MLYENISEYLICSLVRNGGRGQQLGLELSLACYRCFQLKALVYADTAEKQTNKQAMYITTSTSNLSATSVGDV